MCFTCRGLECLTKTGLQHFNATSPKRAEAMGVAATAENVERALRAALGGARSSSFAGGVRFVVLLLNVLPSATLLKTQHPKPKP